VQLEKNQMVAGDYKVEKLGLQKDLLACMGTDWGFGNQVAHFSANAAPFCEMRHFGEPKWLSRGFVRLSMIRSVLQLSKNKVPKPKDIGKVHTRAHQMHTIPTKLTSLYAHCRFRKRAVVRVFCSIVADV
jgi:hypothetical protein